MKGLKFAVVGLLGCASQQLVSGEDFWTQGAGDYDWAQQGADWTGTCQSKNRQSPIDMDSEFFGGLGVDSSITLNYNYTTQKQNLVLVHDDKDINLYDSASASMGTLSFDGTNYQAVQMHWHAASEHLIDSVRRPLELHIIHYDNPTSPTQAAVTGFFFIEGNKENAFLKAIIDSTPTWITKPASKGGQVLSTLDKNSSNFPNLNILFPESSAEVWHYDGSLTTPACTEIVNWLVFPEPQIATKEQISKFAESMIVLGKDSGNFRRPVNNQNTLLKTSARRLRASKKGSYRRLEQMMNKAAPVV